MEDIRDEFDEARRGMIEALLEMQQLAVRYGATWDETQAVQARFFDWNPRLKHAFRRLWFAAEVRPPLWDAAAAIEAIEPQGSEEWMAGGLAMRKTAAREVRERARRR